MKTLHFANHPESLGQRHSRHVDERSENSALSEKGIAQGQHLGNWIHEKLPYITQIIYPPDKAPSQTVQLVVKHAFARAPETIEDEELARMTGNGVGERMLPWAANLVTRLNRETEHVLVVTHSLAIRSLVGEIRNARQEDINSWQLDPGSVSSVEFDDEGNALRAMLNQQTAW